MIVDLAEVWRDKQLLDDIRSEVRRKAVRGWKPWELRLPPDLIWPMISEVSQGMFTQWSPVLDNIGIQVGEPNEVMLRFVLPDISPSPVANSCLAYYHKPEEEIEVRRGTQV